MSPEKKLLKNFEEEGRYVFHGSGEEIEILEPRQAYTHHEEIEKADGEPAVFASSMVDYAILMALVNERNCPDGFRSIVGVSINEKGERYLRVRASQETLNQLDKNSYGWVYVFTKDSFTLRNEGGIEYVSTESVTPMHKIKVTKADLPEVEVFE
jgi:hypothetical protein